MKPTLKPILLFISLLVFSMGANAQRMSRYISEFKVGVNFSEMDIAGNNNGKQIKAGFAIGGNFAVRMTGPLYFRTGAELTKKGLKRHDQNESKDDIGVVTKQDVRTTIDANYVQMPAMIGFEFGLGKSTSVNFYAGGYSGYGFRGITEVEGQEIRGYGTSDPIYFDMSKADVQTFDVHLKRFDYGAIASVGFVYDILSFSLSYEYGLFNISRNKSLEMKNRNTALSVAVRF